VYVVVILSMLRLTHVCNIIFKYSKLLLISNNKLLWNMVVPILYESKRLDTDMQDGCTIFKTTMISVPNILTFKSIIIINYNI